MSFPGHARRKSKDGPCGKYSGNLCGGFGGQEVDMTCFGCGWQRYEHRRDKPPVENSDETMKDLLLLREELSE